MAIRSVLAASAAACLIAAPAGAQVFVLGANNEFYLGGNSLRLGCADLDLAGLLVAGVVEGVRDLTFASGGVLGLNSGATVTLSGSWDISAGGALVDGGGTIQIVDGCGTLVSQILGTNYFETLKVITSSGKILEFESGVTQTVTTNLELLGTAGDELVVRGTNGGSQPLLDVQGSSDIDYVLAYNLDATANPITLGPNSEVRGGEAGVDGAELCSDVTGDLVFDSADVDEARNHLVGRTVTGDITLCNVIGPYDGTQAGLDCGVDDVSLLRRRLAGESVTLVNGCQP